MEKLEVEQNVSWIGARLREPSTYVGLSAILAAIHIVDAQSWTNIVMSLGIGIGGLIGMFLPEKK